MKMFSKFGWMIVFLLASTSVLAKEPLAGLYSSMAYRQGSGDLVGIEIFLIPSREGLFATFQASEGEPQPPVLVRVTVKGETLEITLPDGGNYSGKFIAKFSPEYIIGQFEDGALSPGGEKIVRLKRGSSYWQQKRTRSPK